MEKKKKTWEQQHTDMSSEGWRRATLITVEDKCVRGSFA